MKNIIAVVFISISSVAHAFWNGAEYTRPDGSKISIINKTCSDCPPPAIAVKDSRGNTISTLKRQEKALIISTLAIKNGEYLATMTTGGEGTLRLYDINRATLIKTTMPFGTPKTWGFMKQLSDTDFAVVSPPNHTYITPQRKTTLIRIYRADNGLLKEVSSFESEGAWSKQLAVAKEGKSIVVMSDVEVSNELQLVSIEGALLKRLVFDKNIRVMDFKVGDDGVIRSIVGVSGKVYLMELDDSTSVITRLSDIEKVGKEGLAKAKREGVRHQVNDVRAEEYVVYRAKFSGDYDGYNVSIETVHNFRDTNFYLYSLPVAEGVRNSSGLKLNSKLKEDITINIRESIFSRI
ncbi:hypothetical protein [Quatrionicoccus australiensis]|uniref:hypothetical protein n=1 Tax=Quatrionicoccus australiensis TaxID=138118 RepID=UPI001CF82DCB|nr:hypothetical protein [Quatrionicoccus australiensis]UCV13440.1 hypothetical protein KI612_10680 [Quatrionicoccus australiensis]